MEESSVLSSVCGPEAQGPYRYICIWVPQPHLGRVGHSASFGTCADKSDDGKREVTFQQTLAVITHP